MLGFEEMVFEVKEEVGGGRYLYRSISMVVFRFLG